MHKFISRFALKKTAGWPAARLLFFSWPILLAACATPHRTGEAGHGFTETQLGRNVFAVSVARKGQLSPPNGADLCLFRCAEVTRAYGFTYFVVLESDPPRTNPNALDTPRMAARSAGGGLTFVNPAAGRPTSANTIACFRKQPAHYPDSYEATAVVDRLSREFGFRTLLEARPNPIDAFPLQFNLYPDFLFLPRTTNEIVFLESSTPRRSIVIGILNEWENPCATLDEFKRKAALSAAILGAQAVQILNDSDLARPGGFSGKSGFTAALLLVPKAHLGLRDEGGEWPREELVVAGFEKESLAPGAGLQVGDRIRQLNGVDVRRQKRFADGWLSWTVGENVVITFVRDGTEMTLQATTIAN